MKKPHPLPRIFLVRHGETEWSQSGRHTGHTDIPLTPHGEEQARQLGKRLGEIKFSSAFTSPRIRARQTYELTGLATSTEIDADLREWDYGDYEGRTSAEIRAGRADWNLFVDGAPGGESPAEVFLRAERFVRRLQRMEGNIAVFSHGHFLRVLAICWIALPVSAGQHFYLDPASLSLLGYDHDRTDEPVIFLWNGRPGTPGAWG